MANEEHLEILKRGVEEWNSWRDKNPDNRPNPHRVDLGDAHLSDGYVPAANLSSAKLSNADLRGVDLRGVDLRGVDLSSAKLITADLREANLHKADLSCSNLSSADLRSAVLSGAKLNDANLFGANLSSANLITVDLSGANLITVNLSGASLGDAKLRGANLREADLRSVDLRGADLSSANLRDVDLRDANLHKADLRSANVHEADLRSANLSGADLREGNLHEADLRGADLCNARLGWTILADVDLSEAVLGLEKVYHSGPSAIATSTLTKSKGRIPEAFLQGCGLTDWEIQAARLYDPDLSHEEVNNLIYKVFDLKTTSPMVLHHVFISYSQADSTIVEKLEAGLKKKRIRYWRDVHHMKSGRMEKQIERAIRVNPLVLLVLSERSVESDWVEWEVSKARELEKTEKRDVLCPIALDEAWKTCDWSGPLRRQVMDYNILDFSDPERFDEQFEKLVDGIVENYPPG